MHTHRILRVGIFSLLFVSFACNSHTTSSAPQASAGANEKWTPTAVPTTGPALVNALAPDPAVVKDSKKVLYYLSSDELEGRGVGLRGLDLAADYIASRFQLAGLQKLPGQDNYFQTFDFTTATKIDDATNLKLNGKKLDLTNREYTPIAFSAEAKFDAPVVFVGYGITAEDKKYDDYAGIDVKGKVVIALRYEPRDANGKSRFTKETQWSPYAGLSTKAATAAEHGAAALIFVNPPNSKGGVISPTTEPTTAPSMTPATAPATAPSTQPGRRGRRSSNAIDSLLPFSSQMLMGGRADIPFLQVRQAPMNALLHDAGAEDLQHLQAKIDETGKPASLALNNVKISGEVVLRREKAQVKNVIGLLPGHGPHKDEYVVVGAHYDHLGHNALGGSMAFGSHAIHHGADDNGSGTTAIIETATKMAKGGPLDRSIIFMTFTGEEEGLIGSKYFVEHPLVPLNKIVAMFNMDMVGRVSNEAMWVGGTGTAPEFAEMTKLADAGSPLVFKYKGMFVDKGGMGPSDHESFALKKIPVLFLFSGMHKDYHTPTDTAEKINYTGIAESVAVADYIVRQMSMMPREQYVSAYDSSTQTGGSGGGSGARLGVIPDYNDGEAHGVPIGGISPGSAAEKAGMKAGDVIVSFGNAKIISLQDLQDALSNSKPGDDVKIVVMREQQKVELHATLGGS